MQVPDNSTHWTPENKTSSAMFGICIILGIPGNLAVVVVIITRVKKKSYTLQLILNLAVSDIICLLTIPLWINNHLNGWNLGKSACRFFVVVLYVSVVSNLLTVTLMSVQRYVHVLYPHIWAKLGRRGEMALLISLWMISLVFSGPYFLIYKAGENECELISSGDGRLLVLCSETILCFIFPFLIMLIFYLRLYKKVKQKTFFRHQRMTKMVICILVIFFVVWCPYHVFNLVEIAAIMLRFSYQHTSEKVLDFVHHHRRIVEGFAAFNTCVNPFLYAFSFRNLCRKHKRTEKENSVTKGSTEI
ncbi:leukotriene B4 receptor 1-like [Triplophysa rosa]|uniref:Leukotriene B4 receptor 1-like n=1 Tax=Triplophysa rosa TaxID=992332 RepID=A0A9W8CCZ3_TRIRA|nr:leukotriene B4 receptor 1-like [Triplophysa rosa]KAI7814874.1 putative leukotriene B4 receptor 1-like [Triplophysa rosa]